MIEQLKELYVDSGVWAQPILVSTLVLLAAWSVMMFTVRMVKKFILFSLISIILPNAIGFVGYLEEADTIQEAIVERGTDLSEEMKESLEDVRFSPLYLGLAGSALTALLGLAGIVRLSLRRKPKPEEIANHHSKE